MAILTKRQQHKQWKQVKNNETSTTFVESVEMKKPTVAEQHHHNHSHDEVEQHEHRANRSYASAGGWLEAEAAENEDSCQREFEESDPKYIYGHLQPGTSACEPPVRF